VLPLAVAPAAGMKRLHVQDTAGCSSLLEPTADGGWAPWCKASLERRAVPAITLGSALALAGDLPIRLVKVDAQGLDAEIFRQTPKAMLRSVQAVSLELHKDTSHCRGKLLYKRELCPAAVATLASLGFRYVGYVSLRGGGSTNSSMIVQKRLVPGSSCPTDELARSWEKRFCEIQAYFVNTEGEVPPLAIRELLVA
jgi:hypothetical protein